MKKYLILLFATLLIGCNAALASAEQESVEKYSLNDDDIVEIKGIVKKWTDAIVNFAPYNKKESGKLDWEGRGKYFDAESDLHHCTYNYFLGEGSKASMFVLGYGNKYYKGKKHKAPMVTATMIKKSNKDRKVIKKSTIDFWKYIRDNTFTVEKLDVTNVQAFMGVIIGKGTYSCYNLVQTYVSNILSVKEGAYKLESQKEEYMVVEHRDNWYNSQKRGYILGDISLTIYYE